MKKLRPFIAFLPFLSSASYAHSGILEFGLAGGGHLHNHPGLFSKSDARMNLLGQFYITQKIAPRWKAGVEVSVAKWSSRFETYYNVGSINYTQTNTAHEASPMLAASVLLTRSLRGQQWETAVTLKGGYAIALQKDVIRYSTPSDMSMPDGSGPVFGLRLEQSYNLTPRFGFIATAGVEYFYMMWNAAPLTGIESSSHLLSAPVTIGLFTRL